MALTAQEIFELRDLAFTLRWHIKAISHATMNSTLLSRDEIEDIAGKWDANNIGGLGYKYSTWEDARDVGQDIVAETSWLDGDFDFLDDFTGTAVPDGAELEQLLTQPALHASLTSWLDIAGRISEEILNDITKFYHDGSLEPNPWSTDPPGFLNEDVLRSDAAGGATILSEGSNALGELLLPLAANVTEYLEYFDVSFYERGTLPPVPPPVDVASMVPVDKILEIGLAPSGGWPEMSTHYIGVLEPPASSNGKRNNYYLPVRLSPASYPTPLQAGWNDLGYKLLNNEGKFVDQEHPKANGIEIPPGTPVKVTEVVVGESGVWVGFIPILTKSSPAIVAATKDFTRVLYTHPEYLRKREGSDALDPILSYTLMPYLDDNPRPSMPDGLALIKPDSNLNWKTLEYADVHLAYYNFDEHNKKFSSSGKNGGLSYKPADIDSRPRLRYSEGYYYFVTLDGNRKSVGELLDFLPQSANAEQSPEMKTAKTNDGIQLVNLLREKALYLILEYAGKSTDPDVVDLDKLIDVYTVDASQNVSTSGASGKNTKILFAVPAQIVDALPNSLKPYSNQFEETSDFYENFGQGGRNYTFTIKVSDIKRVSDGLVKIFTKIKSKLTAFKSEGGIVKNSNNVNYNIESQIERFKAFPDTIQGFLTRQTSAGSRDKLSQHLLEGLNMPGDAFLQFGLRDNGKVGPSVRQTVSFVLYSPDPSVLLGADKKEFITLDPDVTEEDMAKGALSRTGVALKKALPWIRSKFLDPEGCRTLHYFMAHRNLIQSEDSLGKDLALNEWIKLLQAYTVPPLLIKLSRDRREDPDEIDCKKLLEEYHKSPTVTTTESRQLQEYVEKHCGHVLMDQFMNDTSAADPASTKKEMQANLNESNNLVANKSSAGAELLTTLYEQFLHVLDPQGLIALLMSCLQSQLGIPMTSAALCEVALEKMIESIGVDEFKRFLVKHIPEIALFFPELQAGSTAVTPSPHAEEFEIDVGWMATTALYEGSPMAAAISLSGRYAGPDERPIVEKVADLERQGHHIPLVSTPEYAQNGTQQIADQTNMLHEKGYSSREVSAALVRDNFLMIPQTFIEAQFNPAFDQATLALGETADVFTEAGQKLSNLPGTPTTAATGATLTAAGATIHTAKEFMNYLKQIIDLQALCEKIVGPLLQGPSLLFSDPDKFVRNWQNWGDNLLDSLKKQFKPPESFLPTNTMPDDLSTDDHIGDYATQLLQIVVSMIVQLLAEMLNALLREILAQCYEPSIDIAAARPEPLSALAPSTVTVPLPTINDIMLGMPSSPDAPLDWPNWLQDIIDSLSTSQLCALLKYEAGFATLDQVLARTENKWPTVWEAGMDNAADIQMVFKELGEELALTGGLDICDAIQATAPILVSACDATYDYDARCAELQLAGLSKEECDEQILQEVDDLRNKIMAFAGMLFPDQNPLENALPEPCGKGGYFMLPSAMKQTMSRVTDNFLTAVKTSLLNDLESIKFFSAPPRALLVQSDPDEMSETYGAVMQATELPDGRHEKLCVIPLNPHPALTYASLQWDDNWDIPNAAKKGFLPLTYSSLAYAADGLGAVPYSPSSVQFPDLIKSAEDDLKYVKVKESKPKNYYTIANLFHGGSLAGPQWGTWRAQADYDPAFVVQTTQALIKDKVPGKFTFTRQIRWNEIKAEFNARYPDASGTNLRALGAEFSTYALKEILGSDDDPKQSPKAHKLVLPSLDFYRYRRANLLSTMYYGRTKKYCRPFRLNEPVKSLLTPGERSGGPLGAMTIGVKWGTGINVVGDGAYTFEIVNAAGEVIGAWSSYDEDAQDMNFEEAIIAGLVTGMDKAAAKMSYGLTLRRAERRLMNMFAAYVGVPLGWFAQSFWDKTIWDYDSDGSGASHWVAREFAGSGAASATEHIDAPLSNLDTIASYAKTPWVETYFDAFMRMPIGEAIGITKDNLRKAFASWPRLYESIADVPMPFGGVYFDMMPQNLDYEKFATHPRPTAVSTLDLNNYRSANAMNEQEFGAEVDDKTDEEILNMMQLDWDDKNENANFLFNSPQITPCAIVMNRAFRNTNNKFETMSIQELIPGLSDKPVNKKLVQAFDDASFMWSTFPAALYKKDQIQHWGSDYGQPELYRDVLSGLSRQTGDIPGLGIFYSHTGHGHPVSPVPVSEENSLTQWYKWTNYNPNVFYFPMPFKNPLASGYGAYVANKVMNSVGDMSFDALGAMGGDLKSSISTVNMENTLVYQEYGMDFYNTPHELTYGQELQDMYTIAKGKLAHLGPNPMAVSTGGKKYNPISPLLKKSQVHDAEYNFEIAEKYDDDIQELLGEIGLSSYEAVELASDWFFTLPDNVISDSASKSNRFGARELYADGNTHAIIFAKLMYNKFMKLANTYAQSPEEKEVFSRYLAWSFAGSGFTSCRFAYVNKVFGKLRLSRLHKRKYMKKLWNKVLKTPLSTPAQDAECNVAIKRLVSKDEDEIETDFFDVDKVKSDILKFYKESVCRDVYETNIDKYTAAQKALIEGAISLLIRVYCMEMCLAGIISWDAYDLSDVFSESIIMRILVKNMKADIENFDILVYFANDAVKKEEDIKSAAAYNMHENTSGLEYLIKRESENVNSIIKKLFNNPKQLSTKLTLKTVFSDDPSLGEEMRKILEAPTHQAGFSNFDLSRVQEAAAQIKGLSELEDYAPYPVVNYMTDNIFTHNYYDGSLENRYLYNKGFLSSLGVQQDDFVYGPYSDGQSPSDYQDFSGFGAKITQRNFFHSPPLTYYATQTAAGWMHPHLLDNSDAVRRMGLCTNDDCHDAIDQFKNFYQDLHHQAEHVASSTTSAPWPDPLTEKIRRILSSKLFSDPSQMINQHEYVAGNILNSRLGNFIFQPYVKIIDQDDRGKFRSRASTHDITNPCDLNDKTQGSIVSALDLLGTDPVLASIRRENNPFGAWIYDIIPLSVFSWFMSDKFMPWINKPDNTGLKLIYNDHGLEPFFKNVSYGIRLVYVSSHGPFADTAKIIHESENSTPGSLVGQGGGLNMVDEIKGMFGTEAFKRSKAGLVSRVFSLEDADLSYSGLPGRGARLDQGSWEEIANENDPVHEEIRGKQVGKLPQLFNELHIPVAEIEKEVVIKSGAVFVDGKKYDFNKFCYTGFIDILPTAGDASDLDSISEALDFNISDFANSDRKGLYKSLTQTPTNFYFKHLASQMLHDLQQTPEFRLIFNHLIPIKRYMALGFLYSSDAILDFIGEPTDLLDGSKATILNYIDSLLNGADDYTYIPAAVRNQAANDMMANMRGTKPPKGGANYKAILRIIFRCMLMILKGFVELTDPAVKWAIKIIDIAKMVYGAIIMAIEAGLAIAKQAVQASIDAARMAKLNAEISLSIAGAPVQGKYVALALSAAGAAGDDDPPPSNLNVAAGGPALPAFDISPDTDVSDWKVDINESWAPASAIADEWASFKTDALVLRDSITVLAAATRELRSAEKEMEEGIGDFERELQKVKDTMEDIFGSNYLLPATWAALLPSMLPYGGGIIPPPWVIGPPSTIPGVIYLILLMLDFYEEKEIEEAADDSDCDGDQEL